jgi:hypothetical protein
MYARRRDWGLCQKVILTVTRNCFKHRHASIDLMANYRGRYLTDCLLPVECHLRMRATSFMSRSTIIVGQKNSWYVCAVLYRPQEGMR